MQLVTPRSGPLCALHIGGYWRGPNDMVRNMMVGLAATGANVREFDTDEHPAALDTEGRPYERGTNGPAWLRSEVLEAVIRELAPHLVVCNAGGLSFRPEFARRLRRRTCLLGIALSDPDVFDVATRHIAPNFDRFLTNDPSCVPRYEALGVSAGILPIATNESFFRPVAPRPELACEVLVMGGAHASRIEPVRALCASFVTHLYGEGWDAHGLPSRGLIFGDDALAALASAQAVVVFFLTPGGHALVKVGLFDFAAAGALVVTNRFAGVEPYFRYDHEIVGFASTEELLAKIRYYLDHPHEAAAVRAAGRARVLAEHTWPRAWTRILADLTAPRRTTPGVWSRLRRVLGARA